MLLEPLWSALTEVGILFQIQCSTTLGVNKDQELEGSVVTILCNLKKIFPPIFFDSMEHLIVHLPYETHVGGLMEYRWMYQFERNDDLTMNDNCIQWSIFKHAGQTSGAPKKRWLSGSERHIIECTSCAIVK
ncbi:UNVERIFIED_CONTAM: hypothetical protein Sradi_5085000 [Sesamum radiatum]|uniref:DUF4218 domain-containing protein n=1 Tax=Sesamum radiatum TaxID=300843 RepID=A0AAW2M0S1_SESRA